MKQRESYFDSLRGIAIIGVVLIHCITFSHETSFSLSVLIRQLINFSVPLFVAISGYFLANKKIENFQEYVNFLKKQILRVYLPYLVWSLVFVLYYFLLSSQFSLLGMLKKIAIFQTRPIFYFVALIIQYYILAPILLRKVSHPKLIFSALISLLSTVLINYYFDQSLSIIVYAGNAFTWVLFFYLGIYIKNFGSPIPTKILLFLVVVFYVLSVFETDHLSKLGITLSGAVTAVKASSFLYSASVISLLLGTKRTWRVFSDLGRVSYGVFLCHLLILGILTKLAIYFGVPTNALFFQLGVSFLVTLLSYGLCKTVSKLSPQIAFKYFGI